MAATIDLGSVRRFKAWAEGRGARNLLHFRRGAVAGLGLLLGCYKYDGASDDQIQRMRKFAEEIGIDFAEVEKQAECFLEDGTVKRELGED